MFLWLVVKNSIELFLNGVNLSTDQSKVNTKVLYNIRMESGGAKEILEYKELLDQRIITEEEFEV